jgi:endonuclease/exonuclease/phosphatase (EEP) superfamily protein YafD
MRRRTLASHDLDPFSVLVGAILALVGLAFLFLRIDVASFDLERVWPVALIVVGLLIVLVTVRPWPRRKPTAAASAEPDTPPDPD